MDTSTDTIYTESQSDSGLGHQSYYVVNESPKSVRAPSSLVWSVSPRRILSTSQNWGRIKIHKIPFGEKTLIRRERIFLPVTKSDCGNYYMIESEDLDIQLSEETLEDLEDVFEFMLKMTWEDYGNSWDFTSN